jgi:hypothetical protein
MKRGRKGMSLDFSKKNEDWLYQRVDLLEAQSQQLSDEYKAIDAELNRRADLYNVKEQARKAEELIKKQAMAKALADYEAIIAEHGNGITMKAIALEFGENMREDYIIDSLYTVISQVSPGGAGQFWPCEDLEAAKNKIEQLIYYRAYDRHFRDGTDNETIVRLKNKIVEMKLEV